MSRRFGSLLALLAAAAFVAGGCGGGGASGKPVAVVGDTTITSDQVLAGIEQLRADRRRKGEGEEFPEPGTKGYRNLRDSVLALLVFRAELEQAAEKLGVHVNDDEVDRLVQAGGGAPGEGEGGSLGRAAREFARASLRTQLLYDRIYARVAPQGDPAARRAAMSRFIARMRRDADVRYEPGYAPGS
jgi:hypothetical protein